MGFVWFIGFIGLLGFLWCIGLIKFLGVGVEGFACTPNYLQFLCVTAVNWRVVATKL